MVNAKELALAEAIKPVKPIGSAPMDSYIACGLMTFGNPPHRGIFFLHTSSSLWVTC
jgi:hypothetical protein